jgi:hypothetical protein
MRFSSIASTASESPVQDSASSAMKISVMPRAPGSPA